MAIHGKTGDTYVVIGIAINANNGQEGSGLVVVYERAGKLFTRNISEFKEKFFLESEKEGNMFAKAERGER